METHDNLFLATDDETSSNDITTNRDYIQFLLLSDSDDEISKTTILTKKIIISKIVNNYKINSNVRDSYYVRDRLVWCQHIHALNNEGPRAFHCLYRMSLTSFTKLCSLLNDQLQVDSVMSTRRTKKLEISSEIILANYLRYIGGGAYLDI
jgi:hypothetical protein